MLIQTLRRLESNGLVQRTSFAEVPPRVEYELTELGWSLSSVVTALDSWVEAHAEQMSSGEGTTKRRFAVTPAL